jgi:hypothetical protein
VTIDKIVKEADSKLGRCFVNGIYHYRSSDKKTKESFCALSDSSCINYFKKGQHEYCRKNEYK